MRKSRFVFVDVDTQFDFMYPEGKLYVPGAEALEPQLKALMAHARRTGIPVVASADAHAPDDPEFMQFPSHCVQGTPGQERIDATRRTDAQIIPNHPVELDLTGVEAVVIEKNVFDLFANPNSDAVFQILSPDMCYVFGVATDFCVLAAVLGLRQRGYPVTVIEDAIKAVTPEGEARALAEMQAAGVRFAKVAQVLQETVA